MNAPGRAEGVVPAREPVPLHLYLGPRDFDLSCFGGFVRCEECGELEARTRAERGDHELCRTRYAERDAGCPRCGQPVVTEGRAVYLSIVGAGRVNRRRDRGGRWLAGAPPSRLSTGRPPAELSLSEASARPSSETERSVAAAAADDAAVVHTPSPAAARDITTASGTGPPRLSTATRAELLEELERATSAGDVLDVQAERVADYLLENPNDAEARALLGRLTLAANRTAEYRAELWRWYRLSGGSLAGYYRAARP